MAPAETSEQSGEKIVERGYGMKFKRILCFALAGSMIFSTPVFAAETEVNFDGDVVTEEAFSTDDAIG